MLFILVALIISSTLAQRPDNATYCDYYAERKYGANDSDAQFQLIQSIVVLAFGGGFNLSNYTSNLTGILNPGTYLNPETHEYLGVDLHPWFDGSLDTTNSNGYALGVNWLDGGGLDPLYDYTRGAASNLDVRNNTNQHDLFGRFFVSFAQLFGCSYIPALPNTTITPDSSTLNLAYVHKYMNLNQTDLGHFIEQLSIATSNVGFSDADAQYLITHFNSVYNVRCAPSTQLPGSPLLQLPSLCQETTCPLSGTNPDCQAYSSIPANGVVGTATSTATSSATTTPSNQSSGPTLSKGAIIGIAVGGVFALILFVAGASLLFHRHRRHARTVESRYAPPTSGYMPPPPPNDYRMTTTTLGYTEPPYASEMPSPEMKKSNRAAEMESPMQSPLFMGTGGGGGMSPVEMGGGEARG